MGFTATEKTKKKNSYYCGWLRNAFRTTVQKPKMLVAGVRPFTVGNPQKWVGGHKSTCLGLLKVTASSPQLMRDV